MFSFGTLLLVANVALRGANAQAPIPLDDGQRVSLMNIYRKLGAAHRF